jgi:hypothetical protein
MPKVQTAASHARFDPFFHFFLLPLFAANFVESIVLAIHAQSHLGLHIWLAVVSFGLLVLTVKVRNYSLRMQDRVIRLEERLRIAALVPGADVYRLSTKQLIALRFASDGELPALVKRTLAENLDMKTIKSSIVTWRPDYERI